jgi:16S rRNA (cytidine1402-2'-O)-methyltransferase
MSKGLSTDGAELPGADQVSPESGEGVLTLVPTPVGNLGDITTRAREVLTAADFVVAEDTRHSGKLMAHLGIKVRFISFHDHNERRQLPVLMKHLAAGLKLALISDAGTPGLCDPGFRAVRAALEEGIKVEVLPGPSALLPALIGSGLPCDRFIFDGYLPRKSGARLRAFQGLATEERTVIFYESPHRLAASMATLAELYPHRAVVVAKELSKRFETFWRGEAEELARKLEGRRLKGEYVLLIGGLNAKIPVKCLP